MLTVTWSDRRAVRQVVEAMRALQKPSLDPALSRAVNRTGDMARTQVRRALVQQTGLPRDIIVRAVKTTRSTPATLTYQMNAKGGDIALKFFRARETRKGVSAAPFNKRQIFETTFIRGGRFPKRSGVVFHGHVMRREGSGRFPIKVVQSGVIIPEQMVEGQTAQAFGSTVSRVLPQRVLVEVRRLTKGVFS